MNRELPELRERVEAGLAARGVFFAWLTWFAVQAAGAIHPGHSAMHWYLPDNLRANHDRRLARRRRSVKTPAQLRPAGHLRARGSPSGPTTNHREHSMPRTSPFLPSLGSVNRLCIAQGETSLRPVKFSELFRLIEQAGFRLLKEKGSVRYYFKPGHPRLIRVDFHGAREVPTGTCHAILKAAGLKPRAQHD